MKRLHSLDALRGVAALSVVLWHWQHFFAISGTWQDGWQRAQEPFYWALRPLYDAGWAAVDLFFALSGFVFFWLYAEQIATRRIGAGRFALLRFSRLYPLHTATLLLVALMQFAFRAKTGTFFIFDANDWQHFLPSLVMAQQWLPPTIVQSFNGPAWSVSVEVLLYGAFFLAARAGLRDWRPAVLIAVVAVALMSWNWFIARGLMGFFLGGATYYLCEIAKARASAARIARGVIVLAALAWVVVVAEIYFAPLHDLFYWTAGHISPEVGKLYISLSDTGFLVLYIFAVVPLTLAALALHEQVLGGRYQRISFLGDISYSSYLLHFPLQLGLVLLALRFGWQPVQFMNGWALGGFYAVLIALSAGSYRFFERPLQSLIRDRKQPALSPAK